MHHTSRRSALVVLSLLALVGLCSATASAAPPPARDDQIKASYRQAFAREPQAGEVQHWNGRSDWSDADDLVRLHRSYIQASEPVREEVVRNSYKWSLGRPGTEDEVRYWRGRRDWQVGRDLVRLHLAFIRANEPVANDVIDAAFKSVLKRAAKPSERERYRKTMAQNEATYTEISLMLVLENLAELQGYKPGGR